MVYYDVELHEYIIETNYGKDFKSRIGHITMDYGGGAKM
jgi:hypothetical protein